jgi:hypothetical protein
LYFVEHTGCNFRQWLANHSKTKIVVALVTIGQIDLPDSGKKKNVTIERTSTPEYSDGKTTKITRFGTRVRRKYRGRYSQ